MNIWFLFCVEGPGREILHRPSLSVCPSRVCHGVCCIVFDTDGMLFEFCMIFFSHFMFSSIFMLLIFPKFLEKKKNSRAGSKIFSFHVFFAFFAISNIFRKIFISKCFRKRKKFQGGGVKKINFTIFVCSFHVFFAFYAIFLGGGGIEKIVVLASEPVGGRSRVTELPCYLPPRRRPGTRDIFLIFYAISNISRKIRKFLGESNYFSFNVFFMFFLCWKY